MGAVTRSVVLWSTSEMQGGDATDLPATVHYSLDFAEALRVPGNSWNDRQKRRVFSDFTI